MQARLYPREKNVGRGGNRRVLRGGSEIVRGLLSSWGA